MITHLPQPGKKQNKPKKLLGVLRSEDSLLAGKYQFQENSKNLVEKREVVSNAFVLPHFSFFYFSYTFIWHRSVSAFFDNS